MKFVLHIAFMDEVHVHTLKGGGDMVKGKGYVLRGGVTSMTAMMTKTSELMENLRMSLEGAE